MTDAKNSHCLWQGELKMCEKILPTFKYGVATKNKGKFVQI
jgi:hypothetical protein